MSQTPSPTPELKLFNTLTGKLEPFEPLDAKVAAHEGRAARIKLYVCGPTVYDEAHLGHARCYITWDVLFRFLTFLGYEVEYVRNVTDVDDKILARAKERGVTPAALAKANYQSFAADMAALNVLPPTKEPRATAHIKDMIQLIEGLISKNAAYVSPEGTVYFRVAADANYGQLSKKPLDDLKSGARVEVDPHKESPLDFALWKHVPEEERTDAKLAEGYCFESPWGRGRPGWHIECSAMNYALLGPQIDIHAGGADLIFPHHENEIAQTETWQDLPGGSDDAHENQRFAKFWLHNGFVNVSGEKMSKSLGNFSTIKKVLERYDANTIRHFLLTNKYRMPVDFNDEALAGSERWIKRIHRWLKNACENLHIENIEDFQNKCVFQDIYEFELEFFTEPLFAEMKEASNSFAEFLVKMSKDLNTPEALATFSSVTTIVGFLNVLNKVDESNEFKKNVPEKLSGFIVKAAFSMFYLLGFDPKLIFQEIAISIPTSELRTIYKELTGNWLEEDQSAENCLETIVEYRKNAKAIKNWAQADAIRKHLTDIGLQILDNKDGTTSVEKDGVEIVRV